MHEPKYRVVGIRSDGSRKTLAADVTQGVAERIKSEIPAGVFADVVVELDTDEPTSGGKRSFELFPDQPRPPDAP